VFIERNRTDKKELWLALMLGFFLILFNSINAQGNSCHKISEENFCLRPIDLDVQKFCQQQKNLRRKHMPQFNDNEKTKKFHHDFHSKTVKFTPRQLLSAQCEIDPVKINGILSAIQKKTFKNFNLKKVIIGMDNYIIDGHHRVAAALIAFPDQEYEMKQVSYTFDKIFNHSFLQNYTSESQALKHC
jgi:hypothetical protein